MLARYRCTLSRAVIAALVATSLLAVHLASTFHAVGQQQAGGGTADFPPELVDWRLGPESPVFTAEGPGHWDVKIRERGWILREDNEYRLWFTGYAGSDSDVKQLGYATSPDGLHWTPSAKNPLRADHWVEDVMVVKQGATYYMFSEGPADGHAELLTSRDRLTWNWEGPLDVRLADGKTPAEKPCGTPTVWIEGDDWYLFYERLDLGIWLAKSRDPLSRVWTNVQDDPVLVPGPAAYDEEFIAVDQVIKYRGSYFAYYHGSGKSTPRTWNTNVARSSDLIHWQKFPGNPLVDENRSSGVVIPVGDGFRLYTMHDRVDVFYPRGK